MKSGRGPSDQTASRARSGLQARNLGIETGRNPIETALNPGGNQNYLIERNPEAVPLRGRRRFRSYRDSTTMASIPFTIAERQGATSPLSRELWNGDRSSLAPGGTAASDLRTGEAATLTSHLLPADAGGRALGVHPDVSSLRILRRTSSSL